MLCGALQLSSRFPGIPDIKIEGGQALALDDGQVLALAYGQARTKLEGGQAPGTPSARPLCHFHV